MKPKAKKPSRRDPSVLTENQKVFVEARLDGDSLAEASRKAGYAVAMTETSSLNVAAALHEARTELSDVLQIRRADVLQMFQEAYDLAKMTAEPGIMVAAAREIGKMLGFYAPERVDLRLTDGQETIRARLEGLSDQELLEIIEGECERVSVN